MQIHRQAVYESLKDYLKGGLSIHFITNSFVDFKLCDLF